MPITNESLVSEIPGCSPAQAVALNRLGITRVGELLAADYESVAVTLESFDEATRILREAKKHIEALSARAAAANNQSGQHRRPIPTNKPKPQAKPGAPGNGHSPSHAPAPSPRPAAQPGRPASHGQVRFAGDTHTVGMSTHEVAADRARAAAAQQQRDQQPQRDDGVLSVALSYAGRGVDLNSGDESRAALSRRLGAASFLLEHEASEADAIASLILEAVEDGTLPPNSVGKTFGDEVAALIEECATIRAVPVSPLGKLPKYYMEMAQKASVSARRICAAHQIANLHLNAEAAAAAGESRGGLVWYARLLVEALEAAGPDPVVGLLRSSVDALSRVAA